MVHVRGRTEKREKIVLRNILGRGTDCIYYHNMGWMIVSVVVPPQSYHWA